MTSDTSKEAAREYAELRFEFGDLDYDHEQLLQHKGREAVLQVLYKEALQMDREVVNNCNRSYMLAR